MTVQLRYQPPLDWDALLRFLRLRATPGAEVVDAAVYRRTIAINGVAGVMSVSCDAKAAQLILHVSGVADGDVVARVRRIFDLDADPHATAARLRRSPQLRRCVDAAPGLRVPGAWDGFELAVRAVLGQQVTVKGATTLAGRLVRAFGTPIENCRAIEKCGGLSHLFPRPAALADADLAPIGLPRARAATIRGLAAAVASERVMLDGSCALADTVSTLCALAGIGDWTAQYIAMRALRDADAFPSTDLGLQRALARDNQRPSAAELLRLAEAWRPYRAYAAMHLWCGGAA
jgi:AraC family transcriptional regulator of adaptative response / DNA-3-methyladenine glycosylase II